MTDRELLEAAAKAARINLAWSALAGISPRDAATMNVWNPLTDDGDALRLAAQLRLTVGDDDQSVRSMAFAHARHLQDLSHCYEPSQDDPAAAYRRAIVRAAAEIGRAR